MNRIYAFTGAKAHVLCVLLFSAFRERERGMRLVWAWSGGKEREGKQKTKNKKRKKRERKAMYISGTRWDISYKCNGMERVRGTFVMCDLMREKLDSENELIN